MKACSFKMRLYYIIIYCHLLFLINFIYAYYKIKPLNKYNGYHKI